MSSTGTAGQTIGSRLGRVLTLLDVIWNALRLLSLSIGNFVAHIFGIRPLYWERGIFLVLAGVLGLVLLGSHDFRPEPAS